jgi:amino acid transporter
METSYRDISLQSFASVGPALNFVALFPVIVLFSGSDLFIATSLGFAISFLAFLPVLFFSSKIRKGGGYSSYTYASLGKTAGIYTGFLYIFYSFLVIPDILMFMSFFLQSYFDINDKIPADLIIIFSIILILSIPVLKGKNATTKSISFLGIIEISGIVIISILMLLFSTNSHIKITSDFIVNSNFWEGVMLSILMFSGSGSGIFLSERTKIKDKDFMKPLISAYIISGIVMILASFALTAFIGNEISSYSNNPALILTLISSRIAPIISFILLALLLLSSYNLMLSYSNALIHMFGSFKRDILSLGTSQRESKIFFLFILVDILLIVLSRFTIGFYSAFLIIAEVVSIMYVVVHLIVSTAATKYSDFSKRQKVISIISLILLISALTGSILNTSTYFYVTITAVLIILIVSSFLTVGAKESKNKFI